MTNVAERPVDRKDSELVQLARDGDADAWAMIVDRYAPYVHAIAVRAFGLPESDADEVFQGVFRGLYGDLASNLGELRGPVGRLTRALCLERRAGAAPAPSEAVVLLQIEAAMDVQGALASIERSSRDLLRRFFVRNETYRAIADDLDLPVTAIPGRIARALDDLCDAIASENPEAGRERR
jgi:DNA-directed RNA polymerase specialized sigma24 family protein